MKSYTVVYPDDEGNAIEEVVTEREIIDSYFDYWSQQMVMSGKAHQVSYKNCIEYWVTINWAMEVV